MKLRFLSAFVALACMGGAAMAATTYYVDGATGSDGANGFPTWTQALKTLTNALTKAGANDQIWVATGTYSPGPGVTDSFNMKSYVSVYGGFTNGGSLTDRNWTNNPTILDGANNTYHVVKALNATNFVLDGFTVTRGNTTSASEYGGGIYVSGGVPMIYNCTIATNAATVSGTSIGGGMYIGSVSDPNAIVSNCLFVGNSIRNIGNAGGGGAYVSGCGNLMIRNCVFRSNVGGPGGGVCVSGGRPTFYRCDFINNNANGQNGGGLLIGWGGWPAVLNCTFLGNNANYGGGSSLYANSTGTFVNCSMGGNTATAGSARGGAIRVEHYSDDSPLSAAYVTNCVFWGDSSPEIQVDASGPTATVGYSDVQGGFTGTGNTNADPLFVSTTSALQLKSKAGRWTSAGWVADTVHSPCIDAGDASPYANEPQPNGGHINMGAYGNTEQASKSSTMTVSASDGTFGDKVRVTWSADGSATGYQVWRGTNVIETAVNLWNGTSLSYDDTTAVAGTFYTYWVIATNVSATINAGSDVGYRATVYYVRADGDDTASGLSWANAFRTVSNALSKVSAGQLWVAAGTYSPGPSQTDSFSLTSYMALYGGFTNGGSMSDRNWSNNPTILDGSNVNYHVVKMIGVSGVTVDGFTVKRGNANSASDYLGGGFYISGGSFAINNCLIASNTAKQVGANNGSGGGMSVAAVTDPAAVVSNCTFLSNSSGNSSSDGNCGGGGVYLNGGSYPTFKQCVLRLNGGSYGGGAFALGSSAPFRNCDFIGNNTLYGYGGAFAWGWGGASPLINCTFVTNRSAYSGGAVMSYYSTGTIVNCSFSGNYAAGAVGGGAAAIFYSSTTRSLISMTNCILWGDSSPEVYVDDTSKSTVTGNYCDIQMASGTYGGVSNINVNPLYASAGDLHLQSRYGRYTSTGSVTDAQSSQCIDQGDPGMDYSLEPFDNGKRINMGAYGNTPQASKSIPHAGVLTQIR